MITLGIETSCDETALCLLETRNSNPNDVLFTEYRILGNIVNSQINLHREFGGVFPMLAKREHIKNLPILYTKLLENSSISENNIDQIAVTNGPGLEPALWTGIVFAKELSQRLGIKILPVNHMEGHIVSTLIDEVEISKDFRELRKIQLPAIALLISGGHTEIVKVNNLGKYEILGNTVDDAVGEAFDKVARMLNLPYPGGPEISKYAEKARNENLENKIKLPRPMIHSKDLKLSFSGLKTAVLYTLKSFIDGGGIINENLIKEISREFENSVTEVLVSKVTRAINENETNTLIIGGGVIANKYMRKAFQDLSENKSIPLLLPPHSLTGDNAIMIALVGVLNTKNSLEGHVEARGNLSLND